MFAAKDAVALAISAVVSFGYAMAFAYTYLVPFALVISFLMFTAPVWLRWFGRPMRLWPVWYLFVFVILSLAIIARITLEGMVPLR